MKVLLCEFVIGLETELGSETKIIQ